jgi:isopenicillin N synthase-like dioxygenase
MTQLFTAADYAKIHSLVFRDDYPGYKPKVIESPNGDGKLDTEKRYAHIAEKYLKYNSTKLVEDHIRLQNRFGINECEDFTTELFLNKCLDQAHELSLEIAVAIGVPPQYWPVRKYGALRVLEYSPTAVTNTHTDLDLFTLMLYRNDESCFKYLDPNFASKYLESLGLEGQALTRSKSLLRLAKSLNSQVHFGELLEEIDSNSYRATKHEVVASGGPYQYSCVYFSEPDHDVVLPSGITVGKWIEERMKRSRYDR